MASHVLPFEKPVVDLVARVKELRTLAENDKRFEGELRRLEEKCSRLARELFADLSPWQKVQLSRHPNRPYTLDYVGHLFEDFVELHGDRSFGDDASIVGGLARYHGRSVVVMGHQKGRGAKENVVRNFGMPHPEGYRKVRRLVELGARFGLPILTFIDTPGAYPGLAAEERGQSEAIGSCLAALARAEVPVIATIIGEGGSGGALALGVANRVHVLEYGTYSVISPEGCAAILYDDPAKVPDAAASLKMTAQDLIGLGIVDEVIPEPLGGAHRDPRAISDRVAKAITNQLYGLVELPTDQLISQRDQKFRKMGVVGGLVPA